MPDDIAPARTLPVLPSQPSDPLHLAVPAHFVYSGQVGGAEHMFYNLMYGMLSAGAKLTLICGDAARLQPDFVAGMARGGAAVLVRGGSGSRFLAEQIAMLHGDLHADAVLFPNYAVPPLLPRRLGRRVAVLHDLQYRHFRANFSERKRLWLRLSHWHAVRRVDRLIVISDFVRRDAAQHLGARFADRIAVVPNPISWERFGPADAAPSLAAPYLLSISAQYAHKNLPTLLRAFALIAPRHPGLRLVLCGQDYATLRGVSGQQQTLSELGQALGIADRLVLTGYVTDAELGAWYRNATAFAFPSLFEGFGMPPVEALGFGLPTIVSNATALPETTLGLAQRVDNVLEPAAWAEMLDTVLSDPARYRPSPASVDVLRAYYGPDRIGRRYLQVCAGER